MQLVHLAEVEPVATDQAARLQGADDGLFAVGAFDHHHPGLVLQWLVDGRGLRWRQRKRRRRCATRGGRGAGGQGQKQERGGGSEAVHGRRGEG